VPKVSFLQIVGFALAIAGLVLATYPEKEKSAPSSGEGEGENPAGKGSEISLGENNVQV
jgi:hypothetical protein